MVAPIPSDAGDDLEVVAWMYEHDGMVHDAAHPPVLTYARWATCEEPWSECALVRLTDAQARIARDAAAVDAALAAHQDAEATPEVPKAGSGGETGPQFVGEPVKDCGHVSDDALWQLLAAGKAAAEDQRYAAGWIAKLTTPPADDRAVRIAEAARRLVYYYIANIDTEHEFISCVTPPHAIDMTPEQRAASTPWKLWDALRAALASPQPEAQTVERLERELAEAPADLLDDLESAITGTVYDDGNGTIMDAPLAVSLILSRLGLERLKSSADRVPAQWYAAANEQRNTAEARATAAEARAERLEEAIERADAQLCQAFSYGDSALPSDFRIAIRAARAALADPAPAATEGE